jgi:CDP-diglyceride synthetase
LRSSLLLRALSSLVLVPVLLLVLWVGGWWFVGLVALVVALATWEYLRMLARLDLQPAYPFAIALGWLVILFFFWGKPIYLQHGVAFLFLGSLTWHVFGDQTAHRI